MIYLIPITLSENATETIPPYIMEAVKQCNVLFVENLRTARRFLKKMDSSIMIDNFQWFEIGKNEDDVISHFRQHIKDKAIIGIMSEAGCPGVADPGQLLVGIAQQMGETVKPLTGPSSILLALMASGLNGQQFTFHGYLPVQPHERKMRIKQIEEESIKKNSTQIFIETPYRNEAMVRDLIEVCKPNTMLCIGCEITSSDEWIKTMTVSSWKNQKTELHKKTAIFLLHSRVN